MLLTWGTLNSIYTFLVFSVPPQVHFMDIEQWKFFGSAFKWYMTFERHKLWLWIIIWHPVKITTIYLHSKRYRKRNSRALSMHVLGWFRAGEGWVNRGVNRLKDGWFLASSCLPLVWRMSFGFSDKWLIVSHSWKNALATIVWIWSAAQSQCQRGMSHALSTAVSCVY